MSTAAFAIPFDTLAFAKELETAGVPPAQAEAQAKALSGVLQKVEEYRLRELATKGDVTAVVETAKVEIIKWTAGMFVAQTALILGAMFAVMKMSQPPAQPPVYQPPVQEMRQPVPLPAPPAAPAR
ncbi:MAG: CCDC90 family protein [Magnetococcus sp. YQC-3]